jgi:hypothetical protein
MNSTERWGVALALPGALLFCLIALPIAAFAALKGVGGVVAWWDAGPNYHVAPTASCLRAHGYGAMRIREDGNPGLWISRRGEYLMSMYFTANADAAQQSLAGMSVSIGTRRNVATDLEYAGDAENRALGCLTS